MARRKRSGATYTQSVKAVWNVPLVRVRSALQLLEDRRLFHPAQDLRPVRSFFTKPRLVIPPAKRLMRNGAMFTSPKIGFEVPRHVAICIRRKTRKEVLHAFGKVGAGGARVSRVRRRSVWSDVSC